MAGNASLSLIIERESCRNCPLGGTKSLDSSSRLRLNSSELYDGEEDEEGGVSNGEVGGDDTSFDQSPRRCGRSSSLPTEHPYNRFVLHLFRSCRIYDVTQYIKSYNIYSHIPY